MPQPLPPLPVAVCGFSGAGKTSLLERLTPVLLRRGHPVGYLKANAHRVDLDREGKDTERLRRAGAAAAAIQGRNGSALFPSERFMGAAADGMPGAKEPGVARSAGGSPHTDRYEAPHPERSAHRAAVLLWNLQPFYEGCDLVLCEGMKASHLPKILVNREDNPKGLLEAASLERVAREFRWPSLPERWEQELEEAAGLLENLLGSPARRKARGVLGAVLAGGVSSRMGRDKAILPLRGGEGSWLERSFLGVAARCSSSWIVGRVSLPGSADLPGLRRPVQAHLDLHGGCGPLGGLETALRISTASGEDAVLASPCDLPDLPGELLDRLLEERDSQAAGTGFLLPDGRCEPALVLLENRALEPVSRAVEDGRLAVGRLLMTLPMRWLALPESVHSGLANRNTPEDRSRYESGPS